MATGLFLKLDQIRGESRDRKHVGWIDLEQVSWGVQDRGGGGGSPVKGDIYLMKMADSTSPVLQDACSNGRVFKTAALEFVNKATMRIDLQSVTVMSFQIATGEKATTAEAFSLRFNDVRFNYNPVTDPGQLAKILHAIGVSR